MFEADVCPAFKETVLECVANEAMASVILLKFISMEPADGIRMQLAGVNARIMKLHRAQCDYLKETGDSDASQELIDELKEANTALIALSFKATDESIGKSIRLQATTLDVWFYRYLVIYTNPCQCTKCKIPNPICLGTH
jgi:hypothetical protein